MACQWHWQTGSIRENTKYVLLYARVGVLFLHSSILLKTDDDNDGKIRILQKRNKKRKPTGLFFYYYHQHHPSSSSTTSLLYPKSWLKKRRERKKRWCDSAYALSLSPSLNFIDEWAEQSAWLSISITHLKEWVMMHNCRCAWIELKIFTRFVFLYTNADIFIFVLAKYLYISNEKKAHYKREITNKNNNKQTSFK